MKADSARSQARKCKIREAVSAELTSWDRATEQRADAEYALELFEADQGDLSAEEFEQRREAIQTAKREEEQARQTWCKAMERAEREIHR
jgi:hypothetical protein